MVVHYEIFGFLPVNGLGILDRGSAFQRMGLWDLYIHGSAKASAT
jgi:hypothetical protein